MYLPGSLTLDTTSRLWEHHPQGWSRSELNLRRLNPQKTCIHGTYRGGDRYRSRKNISIDGGYLMWSTLSLALINFSSQSKLNHSPKMLNCCLFVFMNHWRKRSLNYLYIREQEKLWSPPPSRWIQRVWINHPTVDSFDLFYDGDKWASGTIVDSEYFFG